MRRFSAEEVDWDDQAALLQGELITGILYENFPDGTLSFEGLYRDGLPDGLQQSWHSNGKLAKQSIAIRGHGSAGSMRWYANGMRQERAYMRYGFIKRRIRWSPDGRVQSDEEFTASADMQRFIDACHAKMGFTDWLDDEDAYPIPSARLSS